MKIIKPILVTLYILLTLESMQPILSSHAPIDPYFDDQDQLGKILYNAWHIHGDEFTYNNELTQSSDKFKVRGFPQATTANNVEVTINNKEKYPVGAEKCTIGKIYRICITKVDHVKDNDGDGLLDSEDFDDDNDGILDKNDKDSPNLLANSKVVNGVKYAGFNIRLYQLYPELEISRTFIPSPIRVGETTKVTLTIKNKGIYTTKNLKIIEEVPKQFEIINSPYEVSKNNITFEDQINSKSQQALSYTVRAKGWPADNYIYTYYFDFGSTSFKKRESTLHSIEEPLIITYSIDPQDNVNVSNRVKFIISLKGNDREIPITVEDLVFKIPEELKIIEKSPSLQYKDDNFRWSGTIRYNFKEDIELYLVPQKNGIYNITVEGKFFLRNIKFYKTIIQELKVGKQKTQKQVSEEQTTPPESEPQPIQQTTPQDTTTEQKNITNATNPTITITQNQTNQTNQSIIYQPLPKEKPENLFIGIWLTIKEIFTTLFS